MIFWLIITALIILALAVTLGPYWRKTDVKTPDRTDLNVRLYKHRLTELEADLKNKTLDKDQYEQAVSELKLQLLNDVPENPKSREIAPRRAKRTIIATALLVPALSIGLYALLGNMDIATGKVDPTTVQAPPDVQGMISALAKRLESQPGDVRGWVMLGRSYAVVGQIDNSISAYGNAYLLAPKDPDVLAGLAEALILSRDKQLLERSLELLQELLAAEQNDLRALWLAGYAEAHLGNNDQAVKYWQVLLPLLPPDDKQAEMVRQYIAEAGDEGNTGDPDVSSTN